MEENEEIIGDQGGVAPVPVEQPKVETPQVPDDEPTPAEEVSVPDEEPVVAEVPVEVEPEETPHEEDVRTGVAVEESPTYECTPAETVIAWIAQNGISHVDAIRADGLSEEDKQQAIRDLKMSGKLQGDGSGRVWV